jgi:hypothetical protein
MADDVLESNREYPRSDPRYVPPPSRPLDPKVAAVNAVQSLSPLFLGVSSHVALSRMSGDIVGRPIKREDYDPNAHAYDPELLRAKSEAQNRENQSRLPLVQDDTSVPQFRLVSHNIEGGGGMRVVKLVENTERNPADSREYFQHPDMLESPSRVPGDALRWQRIDTGLMAGPLPVAEPLVVRHGQREYRAPYVAPVVQHWQQEYVQPFEPLSVRHGYAEPPPQAPLVVRHGLCKRPEDRLRSKTSFEACNRRSISSAGCTDL